MNKELYHISISDYECSVIQLSLHTFFSSPLISESSVDELLRIGADYSMLVDYFKKSHSTDIYFSDFCACYNYLTKPNSLYLTFSCASIIHQSLKIMLDNWPAADYGRPEPCYIALTNLLGKFDDFIACFPEFFKQEVCHEEKK